MLEHLRVKNTQQVWPRDENPGVSSMHHKRTSAKTHTHTGNDAHWPGLLAISTRDPSSGVGSRCWMTALSGTISWPTSPLVAATVSGTAARPSTPSGARRPVSSAPGGSAASGAFCSGRALPIRYPGGPSAGQYPESSTLLTLTR